MSVARIVGWSADISIEWADNPKPMIIKSEDLPDWLAMKIDRFLDEIENEENAKIQEEDL